MANPDIPLSDLLHALRTEIDKAQDDLWRSGKTSILKIAEAEIEVNLVVKRGGDAKGEVKLPSLFAVGLGASVSSEQVHKLKLKLEPMSKDTKEAVGVAGSGTGDDE